MKNRAGSGVISGQVKPNYRDPGNQWRTGTQQNIPSTGAFIATRLIVIIRFLSGSTGNIPEVTDGTGITRGRRGIYPGRLMTMPWNEKNVNVRKITMAVATCQQKPALKKKSLSVRQRAPSAKTIRMLGFGMREEQFGIDLAEAADVIRDLAMIQSCTPGSITGQLIRRNRGNTLVFDLDRGLMSTGEGITGRNVTSFFMLDEKIADCSTGILVPGVPTVLTCKCPDVRDGRESPSGSAMPLRGIVRIPGSGSRSRSTHTLSLINLREFAEICIFGQKGRESPCPEG